MNRVRSAVLPALACVLLCGLAGCGGSKIAEPTPVELQAALEGSELVVGGESETIAGDAISSFKVAAIYHNARETLSSAEVTFNYSSTRGTYRVQGVISYRWSQTERIKEPRFEANEVTGM